MSYQELYQKYQNAIKMRDLATDKNYHLLRDIFYKKIIASVNYSAQEKIVMYLAGIKDVFAYVDDEAKNVDNYRDQLDNIFAEQHG